MLQRIKELEDERADYGKKQSILKKTKEGKSNRNIGKTLGIANATIYVLKKKENICVIRNSYKTVRPWKTVMVIYLH